MSSLRWLGASLLLVCVYSAVVLAGDTRAGSGSDPVGKMLAVAAMADNGIGEPDIGYWAEEYDPDGRVHPVLNTRRYDDAWTQVVSLPFALAAVPLWRIGGSAGVLVLSMLGGVAAAFGARSIARGLGGDGVIAFWVVGAGSIALHYVGDFWEHLPALGLALLALGLLLSKRVGVVAGVGAGALAGLSVTMRRELVFWFVAFAVVALVVPELRRRFSMLVAGLAGAAAVVVAAGVALAERAWLGSAASVDRTADQVAGGASQLGDRVADAVITTVGVAQGVVTRSLVLDAAVVVGLVLVGLALRSGAARASAVAMAGAALDALGALAALAPGLVFVPGMVPSQPMAGAAVASRRGPELALSVVALAPLPAVWAFQWVGGMDIQWGGRYVMLGGALLSIVGSVAIERVGVRSFAGGFFVAATAVMALATAAFHIDRTRTVAAIAQDLAGEDPDTALVLTWPFGRESGLFIEDRRWLEADGDAEEAFAFEVLAAAGITEAERAGRGDPPSHEGWSIVASRTVDGFRGSVIEVTTYRRSG